MNKYGPLYTFGSLLLPLLQPCSFALCRLLLLPLTSNFASKSEFSAFSAYPFISLFFLSGTYLWFSGNPTYKMPKLPVRIYPYSKSPKWVTLRNRPLGGLKYLQGYYRRFSLPAQIYNMPLLRSSIYGSSVRASNGKRSDAIFLQPLHFKFGPPILKWIFAK